MSTQTIDKTTNGHSRAAADGMRKAAILVSALDRDTVDAILDQMGPAQAALVRQAVMDLGDINPAEQERILEEFLKLGKNLQGEAPAAQRSAARIGLNPSEDRRAAPARKSSDATPFGFLEETQIDDLAAILAAERPQTIALVLSRMPPARAGRVLVQFSPDTQAEVVRRLVDLEETTPDILREVELELQKRLSHKLHMERRRVAGVPAVAGIINACDGETAAAIMKNLAARDDRLARRFAPIGRASEAASGMQADPREVESKRPTIEFADLDTIDADTLGMMTENVDREVLVLALLGAPASVTERILRLMPRQRAAAVRSEIKNIGPVRLADVEEARRLVLETISRPGHDPA